MININNQQNTALDTEKLKQDASTILNLLNYPDFDLGILLVDQDGIKSFNKKFREKDKPTDILSFPYHPELEAGDEITIMNEDDKNLGDIILCPAYIQNDLERWGKTYEERIQILLVHGICHLLGYDHIEDSDYEVMKQQEDLLLNKLK